MTTKSPSLAGDRSGTGWRPTAAHARALLGGLLLSIVGVLARRQDLVVLGSPLVCAAVWAALRRPSMEPVVRQGANHTTLREGQATTWWVSVEDSEGLVDDVATMLRPIDHTDFDPPHGETAISMRDDAAQGLDVIVRSTRWGRRRVGPALVVATSALGAFRSVTRDEREAATILTLPAPTPFDAAAPPVRSPGLVGGSRSPRQGDGTEFASIRPFQPGDRLRRIHWRQSLRTGTLHATASWADHDRQVVIVLDAHADVGVSDGIDGRASSLDVTVRAAAAIAEHHIGVGDRVGVVLIGSIGVQRMPAATGRRHLRRLLEVMASIKPLSTVSDDGRMPRGLGHGALVVLLSPLLAPGALRRAAMIASHGFAVVVVDCLPSGVSEEAPGDPFVELAWRIELLRRERAVRQAIEAGIPVVPWRGPGTLDVVLRDLHRQPNVRAGR